MTPHKIPFIALVLAVPLLLSSCGGGGSSGGSTSTTPTTTTNEIINGISVPPEPDPTANNATLAGIDSNSNGVRDDVERKIAERVSNQNDFTATMKEAVVYEWLLSHPAKTKDDGLKFFSSTVCAIKNPVGEVYTGDDGRFPLDQIYNTPARQKIYTEMTRLTGAFAGDDLMSTYPCQN
jgi:hypothetical protein